ncbi:MAG: MGMT family protein [Desulfurococcaceae archaeon]|nr:MGMT family protein [Desulfurococcaceae archaeon]
MVIHLIELKNNVMRNPTSSELCEAVYILIQLLNLGEVTSYNDLAKLLGVHPRTISKCLKYNHHVIAIPCHRVIYKNLMLGGYSLGAALKEKLLKLEGVSITNGRASKSSYRYLSKELLEG